MTPRKILALAAFAAVTGCATGGPRYLAKVNGELVTAEDLREEFGRSHRAMEKTLGEEKDVRRFLSKVVDRRLFIQEGYRMGIPDQPGVKADVERFRSQRLVAALLDDEVEARSKAGDDEVFEAYVALAEVTEARQVAFAKRAEAEEARAAVAGGADLEKLARERSIAPSALHGGALAVRWGGDVVREKALAATAVGELTPVYETGIGWEFARIEKRRQSARPPFDKVQAQIRATIDRRKHEASQRQFIEQLWAKYDVKLLECAPRWEDLEAAVRAPEKEPAPCATWTGGGLTTADLGAVVKPAQLAAMKPHYAKVRPQLVEELANRRVTALEAEARGYAARKELVRAEKGQQDAIVETTLFTDWVVTNVTVTDADARAYHASHPDLFMTEPEFELAQIVVDTAERAAEVEAKLKAGTPFGDVARSYSQDTEAAASGGYAGKLPKSALGGEFAPVAFLTEGQVSAPISSDGTFRIVKVLSVVPEKPRPYEAVADRVRKRALAEKKKVALDAWIAKLRADASIVLDEDEIRAYDRERRQMIVAEEKKAEEKKSADAAKLAALQERVKALPPIPKDPKDGPAAQEGEGGPGSSGVEVAK